MSAATESLDRTLGKLSAVADDLINLVRAAHTIGKMSTDDTRTALVKWLVEEAVELADCNATIVNMAMEHAALLKIPAPKRITHRR